MAYEQRRSAPISVHFIAILYYLGGAFTVITAAAVGVLAATGGLSQVNRRIPLEPDDRLAATAGGVAVMVLVGLVTIWFGRRLQLGRQWARVLLLTVLLLSSAAIAVLAWQSQDPTMLIVLIQPAFYVVLLNTRAARSWFKRH